MTYVFQESKRKNLHAKLIATLFEFPRIQKKKKKKIHENPEKILDFQNGGPSSR